MAADVVPDFDDFGLTETELQAMEEDALEKISAQSQQQQHRPPAPPLPPRQNHEINFSPPREFSQRSTTTTFYRDDPSISGMVVNNSENDGEMDRLKKELGRVSKQLANMEQECYDLRKERDKTEKQLKSVLSHTEGKDVKDQMMRHPYMAKELHPHVYPHLNQNTSNEAVGLQTKETCAKGVQTEETDDYSQSIDNGHLSTRCDLPRKLLTTWGSPTCRSVGQTLVSKLMVACSTDLQILFGFLSINISKNTRVPLKDGTFSKRAIQDNQSVCSSEAAKVSHFHTMFTKVNSGMVQLQTFLEALLDLCNLPNVDILYRSLRILHVVLDHMLGSERKCIRRNNVTVEGCSTNNNTDVYEFMCPITLNGIYDEGHILSELGAFNSDVRLEEAGVHGIELPLSFINWVSLFELMYELSVANTDEHIRFEAVSIMNVVLLKSSSYLEKEQFGPIVFQSVSKFLRKEAGSHVQKKAVHLLYNLLNCPKQLVIFCSGCIKDVDTMAATDNAKDSTLGEDFSGILEGLGECITDSGHDLELRQKLAEAKWTPKVHQERVLLVREALIFRNRLISNPACSSTALRIITSTRDVAGWTVDIGDRLSHTGPRAREADGVSRKMWESEIIDLGRVFRRRVYAFLGDSSV